jgi:hypothetical protein
MAYLRPNLPTLLEIKVFFTNTYLKQQKARKHLMVFTASEYILIHPLNIAPSTHQ